MGLPEPLGLKQTGVTPQQFQVYENFGKQPLIAPPALSTELPPQSQQPFGAPLVGSGLQHQGLPQSQPQQPPLQQQQFTTEQTFNYFLSLVENLFKAIAESKITHLELLPEGSPITVIIDQLIGIAAKNLNKEPLLLKVAQFIVNALFTTSKSDLAVETFVSVLVDLCSISASTKKDVVWWLVHAQDERKFNSKVVFALLKSGIIRASEIDESFAKSIPNENNSVVIDFIIEVIEKCVLMKNPIGYRTDFVLTIERLNELKGNNEVVKKFIEKLNNNSVSLENPADKCGYIFTEWVRLLQHQPNNEKLQLIFINQMISAGILNKSENVVLFIKNGIEISINYFNKIDPSKDVFLAIDSLSKLIVKLLLVQNEPETSRAVYFKLILSTVSLIFANDHEKSKENFNERPYFRIFSTLLTEWSEVKFDKYSTNDEELELLKEFNQQFYLTIADFFNIYQPLAYPGFTFAWITLISHRMFLPYILELKNSAGARGQGKFVLLLLDLLRFESKYIKDKEISEVISVIYKGTVRIFLLLLHDYPEVLIQHHYQLCCEIPLSFIQLRNMVLSAFPKEISMPDPFTQGLKVDRIPEISESPEISYNPINDLKPLKKSIEGYLRIPSQMLLKTIMNGLKQTPAAEESGIGFSSTNYNVKMINALVLHVGIQATNERQFNGSSNGSGGGSGNNFNPKSSQFLLLAGLMQEATVELQYHLMEAICNNLRYPNSHTHWFSYLVLHFFGSQSLWNGEGKKLQLQQVITRVLLERIICNRPHPWGLLITFTELIKNTELQFSELPFTKCAPEIEKMFGSLLQHVGGGKPAGQSVSA